MLSAIRELLDLNVYSATLVATAVVGMAALWLTARAYGLDFGLALDAALAGLVLGIVAGRVEVVLANQDYFRERSLSAIVDLRSGGLGHRSLTVAGVAAFLCIAAGQRRRWRDYASALAPAVALASAVAWAGLAFVGLGAGAQMDSPVLVRLPDAYGVVAPRLPLQFAMAGGHVLLAGAALLLFNHLMQPGLSLCLWGAASCALAAVLDGLRAEPVYLTAGVPRAAVADATLALAWMALAVAILLFSRNHGGLAGEAGMASPTDEPADRGDKTCDVLPRCPAAAPGNDGRVGHGRGGAPATMDAPAPWAAVEPDRPTAGAPCEPGSSADGTSGDPTQPA